MVTLTSYEWNNDVLNWSSFVGGAGCVIVAFAFTWFAWSRVIEPAIERRQLRKEAEFELRLDQMRTEIRLEIEQAFGAGDSEELPDGSTRHQDE